MRWCKKSPAGGAGRLHFNYKGKGAVEEKAPWRTAASAQAAGSCYPGKQRDLREKIASTHQQQRYIKSIVSIKDLGESPGR